MERRVRGNSHARCEWGEKLEITSKTYLSISCVKKIKDEEFNMSESLIYGMPICHLCEKRALIRSAIGKDHKRMDAYVGLLKRMKASKPDLRTLIIENRAQLIAVSKDSITVKVRDDQWQFVKGPEENELYHNNYRVLSDYSREFTPGFHQHLYQRHPRIGFLIKQVCQYSWIEHIKTFRQRIHEEAIKETSEKIKNTLIWQYEDQNEVIHTYVKLLDCNGYARRCFRNEGIGIDIIDRVAKHDEKSSISCELLTVRIRRDDVTAFHHALRRFRSYIIQNEFDRYADLCKRYIEQNYLPYMEPTYPFWGRILVWAYRNLHKNKK